MQVFLNTVRKMRQASASRQGTIRLRSFYTIQALRLRRRMARPPFAADH